MAHQSTTTRPARRSSRRGRLTYGSLTFLRHRLRDRREPGRHGDAGGNTHRQGRSLTAAAVKLDAQHSVVTADGWPFTSPIAPKEGAGALDGAVDSQGKIQLTGWWKKTGADPSQVMTLTVDPQGYLVGGMKIETEPKLGDNAGLGVTHLEDGTLVVAASVTSGAGGSRHLAPPRPGRPDDHL
jgi:hypothetical protein